MQHPIPAPRRQHNVLDFFLLDVFSSEPFGGNPLSVFPAASGVSPGLMQKLANEANLSETAFICGEVRPGVYTLRIFTPRSELPFAGHPVIGAAKVMELLGRAKDHVDFESPAGLVRVKLQGDKAVLTPPRTPASVTSDLSAAAAAQVLGLERDKVTAVSGYDAGIPVNLVELRSPHDVASIRFSTSAWSALLECSSNRDVYAFAVCADSLNVRVVARMFAPADGIMEDAATGSAAAALGGYLRSHGTSGRVAIAQGFEMGRPSHISLEIFHDRVEVGGSVRHMGRGEFDMSLIGETSI